MQKRNIPIKFLFLIFAGTSRRTWERRARAGLLGPVYVETGAIRNRMVDSEEIERRIGAISEQQFAKAFQQYEADRRPVQRVAP